MANLIFTLKDNDSFLRKANAGVKLLSLIVLSTLLTGENYFILLLIGFVIVFISISHKILLIKQLAKNWFLILLAAFIFISDYISTRNLFLSSISSLKYLSLICLSILFTNLTAPDETSRALSRFLSRIIGKAGYNLASAVELTLALLPIIFNTATQILDSRKCRNARFFPHPIRAISSYSIALLSSLLDRIEDYSDALEARSYNIYATRAKNKLLKRDYLIIIFLIILTGSSLYEKI